MTAEQIVPTLDTSHALRPSLLTPAGQRQPVFWLALATAAVLHGALVVGLSRSQPSNLGAASGSTDAINVEIVDAGELRAMGAQKPAEVPPPPPPAAQKSSPAPQPPKAAPRPKTEAEMEPQSAPEAAPQSAPEAAPPSAPETAPEAAPPQQLAALPAFETKELKATSPPDAVPKPPKKSTKSEKLPEKPKKDAAKPKANTALKPPTNLDLSVPFDMSMGAASASASSATRPAGITRSGANDRFGRDVIRALKKTMPPSEGITGKVKVRIFLDGRGNVAWVRVVHGSGDRLLDDNVLFSVRQALFPFPPKGATEADRTFLVTYIYR